MKKILLAVLIGLFFVSCESGLNINLTCVLKHTTQVVKLESGILGEKTQILVNLTWTWIQQPPGDGVVVERSTDSLSWITKDSLTPIAAEMIFNDTDSAITAGDTIWYRLGYYSGSEITYFITPKLILPQAQHFILPDTDFVTIDTTGLAICFAKLVDFDSFKVELFKANVTQPESLMNLKDAIWDTTITDTTIIIKPFPDTTLLTMYTLKISSSAILEFITDGSYGFRAFIRDTLPLP
jgi:hypothetical protein